MRSEILDWLRRFVALSKDPGVMRALFMVLFGVASFYPIVNVRQLLSVPKQKNPKGIGLFAHAYRNLYHVSENPADREQARYCLGWLLENPSPGDYAGPCWGYNFAWQTPGFYVPRYAPNMVVSAVVGQACIRLVA